MRPSGTPAMCLAPTMLLVLSNPADARTGKDPDDVTFVPGKPHCLAIKTFEGASGAGTLFVILHGNLARGGPADYILAVAETIAARGVPAAAMMRPGYPGDG